MFNRWRATTNVRDVLQELRDALVSSHPASPAAAETYAGLRDQIRTLTTTRRRHLVHLARLSATPTSKLPDVLAELRDEENIGEEWAGPAEWFTSTPQPSPDATLLVTVPAYIARSDNGDVTVIRRGVGEWQHA
jgi:hypothetical protein